MKRLKIRFGTRLKHLRTDAQLSQNELAEACGVTVETISNIERGIHGPRFELLESLCTELQCQPKDLFDF